MAHRRRARVFTEEYPWFGAAELARSPSVRRGLALAEELAKRRETCALIAKLCERLKMNVVTIATASVYFHVFYARRAMQLFDPLTTAVACTFLAGKVEEDRRRADSVLLAYYKVCDRVPEDAERAAFRRQVLARELLVLETVEYNFTLRHPYRVVRNVFADTYGRLSPKHPHRNAKGKDVVQSRLDLTACLVVNDSFKLPLCLRYSPTAVAVAAVWLAHRLNHVPQPEVKSPGAGGDGHCVWYEHWEVPLADILAITADLGTGQGAGPDRMREAVKNPKPYPHRRVTLPAGAPRFGPRSRPRSASRAPAAPTAKQALLAPSPAPSASSAASSAAAAAASPRRGVSPAPGPPARQSSASSAASSSSSGAAAAARQVHPCPRCKRELGRTAYEQHKEACKARYTFCVRHNEPVLKADPGRHAKCVSKCNMCDSEVRSLDLQEHRTACKQKQRARRKRPRADSAASAASAASAPDAAKAAGGDGDGDAKRVRVDAVPLAT